MGNNNEIAQAALTMNVGLPPTLLARCWTHAVTTKDWSAAKMIAGNDNLDDQLRGQVRRCTNAAVKTAYLNRGDVGADEAFALCADERRPGVLTALSRHSGTERERYLGLLLHAYQVGGNVGLAKAILDASGTQSLGTIPEATAANILVLLAGKRSQVSSHQLGVINRWREGLTGANASAVIGAGRIVDWGYTGHLWLLTAPGRDSEQIRSDTCGWLNAQWHGADKLQLQRLAVQLVRNLGTTCGWSAQTATVADAIRDWVRDEGGASAEIATHIRALAGVPVIARPDGFTAVAVDAVAGNAEPQPVADANYGDVARQLHRMTMNVREKVHVDSDTAHVYLDGPGHHTRAGTPRWLLDSADAIGRAIRSTDPRLVELGWTTAARYAVTVNPAHWRQGWATAATNAGVRNALLAMWRPDMSLAAFDDVSLTSLAWALEETRAVTGDIMLNRAQSQTIEELVRRELFGDVPWTPIQAAVQAGSNWWQTQLRLATSTVAPVLAWLATQVETSDDPENLWVVVNSCSPAFTGTTAELLAAAADTCGIVIDCGAERTRLPIVIHLDETQ